MNLYSQVVESLNFYKVSYDVNIAIKKDSVKNIVCKNRRQEAPLYELIPEIPVLIYKYSDHSCAPCFEKDIKATATCFAGVEDNVILLCEAHSERNLRQYLRTNHLNFTVLAMPPNSFTWEIENHSNRYFFIMYPNGKLSDVFIPDKDNAELTVEYLESVKCLLTN
ncbi:MAG: hypothetical protein LBG96_09700 [Tannerella sp.]|nr:hypothetical protein [Tannerella sp.]